MNVCIFKNHSYLCSAFNGKHHKNSIGEMAEWSIAAVLKTVELRGSWGSNPYLSAGRSGQKQIIKNLQVNYL